MGITKVSFILLLVCFAQQLVASGKTKGWRRLSRPEKVWTFFHPFKARKVYDCAVRSKFVTDSLEKDGTLTDRNGGQLDAFRHAYWMALMIECGLSEKTVRRVGENHEKGNYLDFKKGRLEDSARADSMASVMDRKNNEMGIRLGKDYVNGDRKISLVQLIITQAWNGKLFILRKDVAGNYLDCSGQRINMNEYTGKWSIPKCLTGSDMVVVPH